MRRPRRSSPAIGSSSATGSTGRPRSPLSWPSARRRPMSSPLRWRTSDRSPTPEPNWASEPRVRRHRGSAAPTGPQALAAVVQRYGHFDLAEDAVQEALLAASRQWPADGIPHNPRGWLITVTSRRLTDMLRREQARRRREDTVARWAVPDGPTTPAAGPSASAGSDADDTLILLFMCCHPSLSP